MIGLTAAAALLLSAAGLAKLVRPGLGPPLPRFASATVTRPRLRSVVLRLAGAVEMVIAGYVILVGGRLSAAALGLAYVLLLAISWRVAAVAYGRDCGCFGSASTPATYWHVGVNCAGAWVAGMGIVIPSGGRTEFARTDLVVAASELIAAIALAGLGYVAMTAAPELTQARAKLAASR